MSFPDTPVSWLLGSNGPVHALAYSSSPGTYILTGSADRSIRLYNPASTDSSGPGSNYSSRITESGSGSGSGSGGRTAPLTGKLIQAYSSHGYEVLSIAVAGDNQRFASSGGDRHVYLWDVTTAQTTRRFGTSGTHGHSSRVNCVAFGGDGDGVVVSGGFDTTVRIWDTKSHDVRPIQVLDDARDSVTAVVVRGAEILAGSVDGRVRGYDIRAGRCVTDVIGAPVTSLSLTRDGRAVLVGSLDSTLRLMDRDSGKCLRSYKTEGWRNTDLRVQSLLGAGEKFVVAGDELGPDETADLPPEGEGRLWAWDLLTGKLAARVAVPWGPEGYEGKKRAVGRDGKAKPRRNVVSCLAWREGGWGNQFCLGGTSGAVAVYGTL